MQSRHERSLGCGTYVKLLDPILISSINEHTQMVECPKKKKNWIMRVSHDWTNYIYSAGPLFSKTVSPSSGESIKESGFSVILCILQNDDTRSLFLLYFFMSFNLADRFRIYPKINEKNNCFHPFLKNSEK